MPAAPEPPGADLAYSLTLGGAIAAVATGWLLWALARGGPLVRWSRLGVDLATLLVVCSFSVHLLFGHRPGSERALGPLEFVVEHPAIVLVGAAALLGRRFLHRASGAGERPSSADGAEA